MPAAPLLSTFRRPTVIASIVLLLVNDHLLKRFFPSDLTGKLSDFAGLFFFPLLLGAIIEWVALRFQRIAPWALPVAIAVTGLLFTAIKTLPAANSAFVALLQSFLSPSAQVVMDPTDLLALAMLPLAWMIGRRQISPAPKKPDRLAYAMLSLGVLASLATPPCMPAPTVRRVTVVGGTIVAGVAWFPATSTSWQQDAPLTAFALTGGDTWQLIKEPGEQVAAALAAPAPALPQSACDPSDPSLCFRIDGTSRIYESTTGGDTWRLAWEIPEERALFMLRMPKSGGTCGKVPELRTVEIAVEPGGRVAVAAGNEGFVMRGADGTWRRMGIYPYLRVTPPAAGSIGEALDGAQPEAIYAGAAALLAWTGLSIWGRRRSPRPRWALHPAWFIFSWLLAGIAVFLTALDDSGGGSLIIPIIALAAYLALLVMYVVLLILALTEPAGARRRAGLLVFAAVLSVLVVPLLVFVLWGYGLILSYPFAAILALLLEAIVFALLAREAGRVLMAA